MTIYLQHYVAHPRGHFITKKVDYAAESMTFVDNPKNIKCDICHFFVAAYLPDPDGHQAVHTFLNQRFLDFDMFCTEMSREKQIAIYPYLLAKGPPEDDHIAGPPVKGFTDPIRAPNRNCMCMKCILFTQGEYLYCSAMDTAFMTKDMDKICSVQDYMTIKDCLRITYKTIYPQIRLESFKNG